MLRLFPEPCPVLPDCSRLLIKGGYPHTAPLHVCLSAVERSVDDQALLFYCGGSRESFTNQLTRFNEDWINASSMKGSMTHKLARVKIMLAPDL